MNSRNGMTGADAADKPARNKRDWFGYLFTTVVGLVITIGVAWYQSYTSNKETAAAELERAKAVTQSAVAIVEEHALNGKKLETDRLVRLIDKRRRDEAISLPITVSDVVERAEFNIASSSHLSIDRKEQIKPIFDAFYLELKARTFRPFPASGKNADVLNEIAGYIQGGKSREALSALKRLSESHNRELLEAKKKSSIDLFDGINRIFSSPTNIIIFSFAFLTYIYLSYRLAQRWQLRRRRNYY
ncbi:MAG TPA: hypothetical protein VJ806_16590 [Luteimonas sp.]|nr:hypothetical protein [Luteimonas sp.]